MSIFERVESQVRSYCRVFPVVFERAEGCELIAEDGRRYLDLFAGAGALNYGHNPEALRGPLIDYLTSGGVTHSLDMFTTAKRAFLESFHSAILEPRDLDYRVLFPGPTGTNAVEAALKLARKATGRDLVIGFTNGFHGMTLGSLSVTGNAQKRAGAGVALTNTMSMPFYGYSDGLDTLEYLGAMLDDPSSGLDPPAAFIVETVQAEGGVNVASGQWLRDLAGLAKRHGIPLIVDDIQVGCGRTGQFFSFEELGVRPDIVCLSKSLSGYGLPLAVVLLRPELDVFEPGEHNGTFRGHNPAFVTATAAIETFWRDDALSTNVARRGDLASACLKRMAARHPEHIAETRGRGLIQGLVFRDPAHASAVAADAFARGIVIETAGPQSEVLKVLPPLTISDATLVQALSLIAESVDAVLDARKPAPALPEPAPLLS